MEDRRHGVGGYRIEGDEGSAPILRIKLTIGNCGALSATSTKLCKGSALSERDAWRTVASDREARDAGSEKQQGARLGYGCLNRDGLEARVALVEVGVQVVAADRIARQSDVARAGTIVDDRHGPNLEGRNVPVKVVPGDELG